jgi:hypothetical protein
MDIRLVGADFFQRADGRMDVQAEIFVNLKDPYCNFANAIARNEYPCCKGLEIAILALFA